MNRPCVSQLLPLRNRCFPLPTHVDPADPDPTTDPAPPLTELGRIDPFHAVVSYICTCLQMSLHGENGAWLSPLA